MTNIREELNHKLNNLSTDQLNSVCQFVKFLEYKQQPVKTQKTITNKDIDRIVELYRQQNK
jgi:hypothetical protein